ncbi:MAG: phosphate ABC transporter permease subunit PstC [Bdellovibrio sp.]|nr:MAG: phosphate ABC transporter permease subunit PstC [Bdellovibrio sp.]
MIFKNSLFKKSLSTLLALTGVLTLSITLFSIILLGKESWSFFQKVPLKDFLFGTHWAPLLEPKSFGVLPLLSGTFMIVILSISLALPLGLLTATFLSEFASPHWRKWLKPALEILAGIPTVVYGYFALTFITPLLKSIYPPTEIFNALSASIVVGIMILPMISSLCDDAFFDFPISLKEGALSLGATPFEFITQILYPASLSRIGAALVLAISRAIGETMAVTIAAGATPKITLNPFESIQTMTAYIVQVSLGDTPAGGIEYQTCFAVGALLFILTFFFNWIGHKIMTRWSWELS